MTTSTRPVTAGAHRGAANGHQPDSHGPPVPPVRQRNLTRTAIGVVVLAVSILGVVSVTATTGRTRRVLVAARTVPVGEAITPTDLHSVRVPSTLSVPTILASDRAQVVGHRAVTTLTAGSVITDQQVGASGATAGTALVGATLRPGQYPTRLAVGDRVLIVITPEPGGTDPSGEVTPLRGVVTDLANDATGTQSTGAMVVSLRVRVTDAPAVAVAGGTGNLDLVVITA